MDEGDEDSIGRKNSGGKGFAITVNGERESENELSEPKSLVVRKNRHSNFSVNSFDEISSERSSSSSLDHVTNCAVILVDKGGRIVDANAQTLEMFQRLRREVVGSAIEILIPTDYAKQHAKHLAAWFPSSKSRKEKTEIRQNLICPAGVKAIRKDGHVIPVSLKFQLLNKKGWQMKKSKPGQPKIKIFIHSLEGRDQGSQEAENVLETLAENTHDEQLKEYDPKLSRYFKDFEEVKMLGSGNYGAVLECRNRLDQELYAVKQVRLGEATNEEATDEPTKTEASQLKEIHTMSRLGAHPNIVRYFSSWTEDVPEELLAVHTPNDEGGSGCSETDDAWGSFMNEESEEEEQAKKTVKTGLINTLFIQMELIAGFALDVYLSTRREVVMPQACHMFSQICRALIFMHASGVIHRDLKPGNILATKAALKDHCSIEEQCFATYNFERYDIKLADFGLSTIAEQKPDTEGGKMHTRVASRVAIAGLSVDLPRHKSILYGIGKTTGIGTKLYAAPEQLAGKENYDDKVDIFALGMVLVELFCPPPASVIEHYLMLSKLREHEIPQSMLDNYPSQAELAQRMLTDAANTRPSAKEILEILPTWLGDAASNPDTAPVTALQKENEELKKRIAELEAEAAATK